MDAVEWHKARNWHPFQEISKNLTPDDFYFNIDSEYNEETGCIPYGPVFELGHKIIIVPKRYWDYSKKTILFMMDQYIPHILKMLSDFEFDADDEVAFYSNDKTVEEIRQILLDLGFCENTDIPVYEYKKYSNPSDWCFTISDWDGEEIVISTCPVKLFDKPMDESWGYEDHGFEDVFRQCANKYFSKFGIVPTNHSSEGVSTTTIENINKMLDAGIRRCDVIIGSPEDEELLDTDEFKEIINSLHSHEVIHSKLHGPKKNKYSKSSNFISDEECIQIIDESMDQVIKIMKYNRDYHANNQESQKINEEIDYLQDLDNWEKIHECSIGSVDDREVFLKHIINAESNVDVYSEYIGGKARAFQMAKDDELLARFMIIEKQDGEMGYPIDLMNIDVEIPSSEANGSVVYDPQTGEQQYFITVLAVNTIIYSEDNAIVADCKDSNKDKSDMLKPSDFYFYGEYFPEYDLAGFSIMTKKYWHEHGCHDDETHPALFNILPDGFDELEESHFEWGGDDFESGRQALLKLGFIENPQLKDAPVELKDIIPESELSKPKSKSKKDGGKPLKTEDCVKYIIDKFGHGLKEMYAELVAETEYNMVDAKGRGDEANVKWYKNVLKDYEKLEKNCLNPKKWKRLCKYKVGSKIDTEGSDADYTGFSIGKEFPELVGGIARFFELDGSDHITHLIVEKDGEIVYTEDYSD